MSEDKERLFRDSNPVTVISSHKNTFKFYELLFLDPSCPSNRRLPYFLRGIKPLPPWYPAVPFWRFLVSHGRHVPHTRPSLPHFGCLWRLLATHVAVMTLKVILCQSLCKCISNLVFCVDREYLDKFLAHMFMKMMIANINVLGPWA